ncbi:hypothetical protein J6590_072379 [Homalodisca vitripennis]|nr:hypothetical protein J6590_072379 [Homalodisca vitripennis]
MLDMETITRRCWVVLWCDIVNYNVVLLPLPSPSPSPTHTTTHLPSTLPHSPRRGSGNVFT